MISASSEAFSNLSLPVPAETRDAHWPPPPHDPRERDLALVVACWEVRLFGGRMFQYFVSRGFWHLQLWHPEARVSVITPSRLTRGFYEAYPIEEWKAQAPDYERLALILQREHPALALPSHAELTRLESAFVDDVVRTEGRLLS